MPRRDGTGPRSGSRGPRDGRGTKVTCTCKTCSVNDNKYICQYKVALIAKKIEMAKDERIT